MKPAAIFFTLIFSISLFADTLKIGWLPYTNTLALLEIHKPIREHLEKKLGVGVEILSAKDYEEFHFFTISGEYDVVVTGPHFGAIALNSGFTPLYKYKAELKPLFVVPKGSGIKTPQELKGKKIALSNYMSISSAGGVVWLTTNGLQKDKDFTLIHAKSHPSAIQSVIIGEAGAAITTMTPIKQLAPEMLEKIEYFVTPFSLPHLFTIANPKLDKKLLQKIKEELKSFEDSESGKAYFEKTGYNGYTEINDADLKAMEPFMSITNEALEEYKKRSK